MNGLIFLLNSVVTLMIVSTSCRADLKALKKLQQKDAVDEKQADRTASSAYRDQLFYKDAEQYKDDLYADQADVDDALDNIRQRDREKNERSTEYGTREALLKKINDADEKENKKAVSGGKYSSIGYLPDRKARIKKERLQDPYRALAIREQEVAERLKLTPTQTKILNSYVSILQPRQKQIAQLDTKINTAKINLKPLDAVIENQQKALDQLMNNDQENSEAIKIAINKLQADLAKLRGEQQSKRAQIAADESAKRGLETMVRSDKVFKQAVDMGFVDRETLQLIGKGREYQMALQGDFDRLDAKRQERQELEALLRKGGLLKNTEEINALKNEYRTLLRARDALEKHALSDNDFGLLKRGSGLENNTYIWLSAREQELDDRMTDWESKKIDSDLKRYVELDVTERYERTKLDEGNEP